MRQRIDYVVVDSVHRLSGHQRVNNRFFGRGGETPPAGPHVEISGSDPVRSLRGLME